MTPAVRHVALAPAKSIQPSAIAERAIDLGVDAPLADARIRDARKIGLPRDARAEPDIERVIPDIELPNVRRVHSGNEINSIGIRYINNIFVSANAVETWNLVIGKLAGFHFQPPAGVCKTHQRSLRFSPPQDR